MSPDRRFSAPVTSPRVVIGSIAARAFSTRAVAFAFAVASTMGLAANAGAQARDSTPPNLAITSPTADPTSDRAPEIVATYSDFGSGIEPTSLSIQVDGVEILDSCSAGPTRATCVSPVLVDGSHTVRVSLRDRAGNASTRSVTFTVDATPPGIDLGDPSSIFADGFESGDTSAWMNPPPAEIITNATDAELEIRLSDDGLGLDPSTLVVTVDGVDVTDSCVFVPDGILCTLPGLAEGDLEVVVEIADQLGNAASATGRLVVDRTPPSFDADEFAPLPCPARNLGLDPSVRACFADALSGIDEESVELAVDGTDRTAAGTIADGCIVWTPARALDPGEHEARITAVDRAGNVGTATWCFDLSAPTLDVTIDSPAPGLFTVDDLVDVTGTVEEGTESVAVNGVVASLAGTSFSVANVPLREGRNVITAVASNAEGSVGTASVTVVRDTTPPVVRIETPSSGAYLTSLQTDVAGLVNDITTGTTINADDCEVFVNGVEAMVANRSFLVTDLLLQRGANTIVVEARDRLGNSTTTSIPVTVRDEAGQRIVLRAGNNQSAQVFEELADPLVVALEDASGDPIVGQPVTFEVSRGDGTLRAFPQEGRSITVTTDDVGHARAFFRLGGRSGAGNNRVVATSPGFLGAVELCADAQPRTAAQITALSGNNQRGLVERPLPLPLVVLVTDAGGNPVGGVEVTFEVIEGGGTIGGSPVANFVTDLDGLASADLVLGPEPGTGDQIVRASFPGLEDGAAPTFVASGEVAGTAAATRLSGLVLDNQDEPVPGATVHVEGTSLEATTDEDGRFAISGVPVGLVAFEVDGSTSTREGLWPHLEFEITTVPGQENTLDRPIYMVQLDPDGVSADLGEDAVLTLDNVPGAELTVYANSVTCPDGTKNCEVSVTQVRSERVPMEPPLGSSFMLAWTIQPAGATFDPPARLCIPNADHAPGQQVEMFSFDHDQEAFVAIGTATVQEDGTQICSDPGFGVVKAGWHGCVPPPPPPTCTSSCDDGNPCTSDRCENGACVHDPVADGTACDDASGCGEGVCMAGTCDLTPLMDDGTPCDDNDACTQTDTCQAGACVGEDPLTCDDGNECTDDSCDPAFGCDFVNNTAPCDDGDLCTLDDVCADGACMPGMPKECDDMDVCSLDMCDPATGDCVTEVDPAMDGMSCGDGSMCGDSLCVMGVCEDQTQMQDGMMCDDMDMCTEMDMCMDGMCIGEEIDFGSSGWVNDSTFTADLKIPRDIVNHMNNAIQRVPGLSGVTFKEARVGVRGRARDCCDANDGLKELGTKEASATGVLTADIRGIPLWGPPTFSREMDFGVAVVSVDFEVGVRFDVNFRINGEIGRTFSECDGEDCTFGSLNASLDPQLRVTLDAILCTDTFWTTPNCGGVETTPAAIRMNLRVGATFNRPCGSGLSAFATLGRIVFRSEFKLGIPGGTRFVFEYEIFPGF